MEYLVPALDRGLRLRAFLAASPDGRAFAECVRLLGVTNAVASSLLRTLAHHRLARKDGDGRWRGMEGPEALPARCQRLAPPILAALAEAAGATALLVLRQGDALQHAVKEQHSRGHAMRPVGSLRTTWLTHPWGWAILASLPRDEQRRLTRAEGGTLPVRARVELARHGCCLLSDQHGERLAAPLSLGAAPAIGAVALGGTLRGERLALARAALLRHTALLAQALTGASA